MELYKNTGIYGVGLLMLHYLVNIMTNLSYLLWQACRTFYDRFIHTFYPRHILPFMTCLLTKDDAYPEKLVCPEDEY